MADVSKIKLPSGTTYNIKDTVSGYTTNTGTITKVQTTAGAHTTINVSSGAAAFNVPTKTSHLTNDSGFITNSILYEANLQWGGKDFSASYGPIDAAIIDVLGANRFAFLRAAGLTIEYSINGGSTWTNYEATDSQKVGLFSSGQGFYLGKHNTAGSSTLNDQLRVTIATSEAGLYTVLNKIAIYMSTSGNTVEVLIEKALESTPTTFITHKDWTGISGWSGWNILNISGLTTYGNTANTQYGRIRFTFKQTAINNGSYSAASISKIMGFGGVGWSTPSNMAATGHLYSYDSSQNATFPANVTATQFNGNVQATTINGVTVGSSPKFTDTDENVSQSYKTASEYTYWRPLLIGYSAGSAATFTPSSTTNLAYTFSTLKVQPSTGTIRINNLALYKGSYTTTFTPTTLTADRTITIPNNTGTMALTSDIPSVPAWALESSKPSYTFSEIGSKPTTISGYGITDAYTKTEVDNKVSAVLRYKGVKATVANLPTSGNTTGDVWHVTATSGEYAWDGTEWQELGTAISIPAATGSATTGVSIADHSSTSIYGVSSSTTSVTGVSGSTSVYGVKSGTNSTTTASKASGANGTAPTLGTAISIYGVKSGTGSTTTASHVKSGGNGTAPTLGTAISLIGVQSSTTTASKVTVGSHSTDYGVKSAGSGSFTQGTFNGGSGSASLTFTMDTTDTKKLVISFSHTHTPATHGADSHTHTAPTLGSKVPTVSASDVTVPIKNASATSIPNVTSAGSASTWEFENVTVPIRADSATSIPNVTSVGSASTWSFTDVTVPIRADSATTVPTAAASATTVPIKNGTATTVITSKTHSVTDNGHTHTI